MVHENRNDKQSIFDHDDGDILMGLFDGGGAHDVVARLALGEGFAVGFSQDKDGNQEEVQIPIVVLTLGTVDDGEHSFTFDHPSFYEFIDTVAQSGIIGSLNMNGPSFSDHGFNIGMIDNEGEVTDDAT